MATSNSISSNVNVFRVKRKRNADPHEALLVSLKRPRLNSTSQGFTPMLYQLATTSEVPDIATIGKVVAGTKLNIIDFDVANDIAGLEKNEVNVQNEDNPLYALHDAVGEIGSGSGGKQSNDDRNQQFTLNGVVLNSIQAFDVTDDFVFDFYWNSLGFNYDVDQYEVRPARREELELYAGDDTESSTGADDDDDSNREDNWRNDYPDEESDDLSGSETDDAQLDSGSESFADLHRRFDNCAFYSSENDSFD